MAKDPAFLFYYNQWIASTQGMEPFTRGCYIQLLASQAANKELPTDLDDLAVVAGVKPSQFSRFEECWKRTLKAKFEDLGNGFMVNKVLDGIIEDRRDYTEKQQERGIVGAFVKRAKKETDLQDSELKQLSKLLYDQGFLSKSKKEREECYKHTLYAFKVNVNVNEDVNKYKGVEKVEPPLYQISETEAKQNHDYLEEFCQKFKVTDNPIFFRAKVDIDKFLHGLGDQLESFKTQTEYYFKIKSKNGLEVCKWKTWILGDRDKTALWNQQDYKALYESKTPTKERNRNR